MAFVIKSRNMYFSRIVDYTTATGYLDKNHPIKLHQFKPTQNKAMIFKDFFPKKEDNDGKIRKT